MFTVVKDRYRAIGTTVACRFTDLCFYASSLPSPLFCPFTKDGFIFQWLIHVPPNCAQIQRVRDTLSHQEQQQGSLCAWVRSSAIVIFRKGFVLVLLPGFTSPSLTLHAALCLHPLFLHSRVVLHLINGQNKGGSCFTHDHLLLPSSHAYPPHHHGHGPSLPFHPSLSYENSREARDKKCPNFICDCSPLINLKYKCVVCWAHVQPPCPPTNQHLRLPLSLMFLSPPPPRHTKKPMSSLASLINSK